MRVLHVASGNQFGGIERYLVSLAQAAGQSDSLSQSFAVCFDGKLSKELEQSGARLHRLGSVRVRQVLQVLRARRAMGKLVEAGPEDVVVFHGPWAYALFGRTAREHGARIALFAHGDLQGRHWLERWARRTDPDVVV